MLKLNMTTTAASLLALAAMLAVPNGAEAGCEPSFSSDSNLNTCVGSGALSNNEGWGNIAIGFDALASNIGGDVNIAIGLDALRSNTEGDRNTAMGFRAMMFNYTGIKNTATGGYALQWNTTGSNNTASGYEALYRTTGSGNTASGAFALRENTEGSNNTASGLLAGAWQIGSNNTSIGARAGFRGDPEQPYADVSTLTGSNNIAVGYQAGSQWGANNTGISNNIAIGNAGGATDANTIRIGTQGTQTAAFMAGITGNTISGGQTVMVDSNGQLGVGTVPGTLPVIPGANNAGMGSGALANNQADGENNMASGVNALQMNSSGDNNTASGVNALNKNSTGGSNTASGVASLQNNTTGNNNTASGVNALLGNTAGGNNTAMGAGAMQNNTSGSGNTALGFGAGNAWTTGSNNIAIGAAGVAGESNTIRIGGSQNRTFIAGVRNIKVIKGVAVQVDANGQIGTAKSSRRYKEDIKTMGEASSPIMNLRPVTFRYIEPAPDGSKPIAYGLIAEEVEQVMPDLVVYNDQGTPESVDYGALPSLLLNEYQKQGRELAAAKADQLDTKTELAKTRAELTDARAKLEAMDAELAALKLAVSRLAAAPSSVRVAASEP
jgi:hypothetical protein